LAILIVMRQLKLLMFMALNWLELSAWKTLYILVVQHLSLYCHFVCIYGVSLSCWNLNSGTQLSFAFLILGHIFMTVFRY